VTARILDGKAVAESIYAEIEAKVRARLAAGRTRPMLATLLVGDDPASATYVRMKQRNCERVGIASSDHRLPASATTDECIALVAGLVDVIQRGALPALVVCHGGSIRAALCHTHRRGLDVFHDWEVPNCAVVAL